MKIPYPQTKARRLIHRLTLLTLVLTLAPSVTFGSQHQSVQAQPHTELSQVKTEHLQDALTVNGIMQHLYALQAIANEHGNNRAAGTQGHQASVEYMVAALEAANYNVSLQPFTFGGYVESAPPQLSIIDGVGTDKYEERIKDGEYATLKYSGSGAVTAPIQAVDVVDPSTLGADSSTSGCEASDFSTFQSGNIALLQRGTCPFGEKVTNAVDAGATAVVVFNEGKQGRTELFDGTLGEAIAPEFPVIATSYAVGYDLLTRMEEGGSIQVRVETETQTDSIETANVIAETKGGDPDNVVMVGGHYDSVRFGPGINDNGSGTATLLEIALQMAKLEIQPVNKVRFAFWSGEELGLLGSIHYIGDLTKNAPESLDDVALYLNFDMIASPNYVRGVYKLNSGAPEGTNQITQLFTDYFEQRGLSWEPITIGGRSDHGPFMRARIPVGGLFSGAEDVLTQAQAQEYGHERGGIAKDPCYHQACDTIENLNMSALNELGDAAAHVLLHLAQDESLASRWGQREIVEQTLPVRRSAGRPY